MLDERVSKTQFYERFFPLSKMWNQKTASSNWVGFLFSLVLHSNSSESIRQRGKMVNKLSHILNARQTFEPQNLPHNSQNNKTLQRTCKYRFCTFYLIDFRWYSFARWKVIVEKPKAKSNKSLKFIHRRKCP